MRQLLSVIVMALLCLQAQAQTAYFKVNNTGYLNKIIKINNGYVTLGNDSNYRAQIIKWNQDFTTGWKIKIDDASVIVASFNRTIEANDGSYYTLFTCTQNSGSAFIIKTSSTGTILWQKLYSLPNNANLLATCISKAAGTDNGFIFGTGQCALSNCVVKCDAAGNIEWQHQYVNTSAVGVITCWGIIPEANGYMISSGYNGHALWNFKTDATGTIQSSKSYVYSAMTVIPTKTVALSNGYAVLCNYNNTNNNKTEAVAFFDNNLSLTSFNELTVTYNQFVLADIAPINNGQGVAVVGSIYDNSIFYEAIVDLSATGSIVWKKLGVGNTGTSNKNVEFYGVSGSGNQIISVGTGVYEGPVVSIMDNTGNGLCNEKVFDMTNVHPTLTVDNITPSPAFANVMASTATVNTTTSVTTNVAVYCGTLPTSSSGIAEQAKNNTRVYPNPATESVVIDLGNNISEQAVKICSLDGKIVWTGNVAYEATINVANWSAGLYMVYVGTDNVRKLSIAH